MAKKTAQSPAKSYIAKAPIRRLMRAEGAGLVAEDAVVLLIEHLSIKATELTKKAVVIVRDDHRKRVTAADIMKAE